MEGTIFSSMATLSGLGELVRNADGVLTASACFRFRRSPKSAPAMKRAPCQPPFTVFVERAAGEGDRRAGAKGLFKVLEIAPRALAPSRTSRNCSARREITASAALGGLFAVGRGLLHARAESRATQGASIAKTTWRGIASLVGALMARRCPADMGPSCGRRRSRASVGHPKIFP